MLLGVGRNTLKPKKMCGVTPSVKCVAALAIKICRELTMLGRVEIVQEMRKPKSVREDVKFDVRSAQIGC